MLSWLSCFEVEKSNWSDEKAVKQKSYKKDHRTNIIATKFVYEKLKTKLEYKQLDVAIRLPKTATIEPHKVKWDSHKKDKILQPFSKCQKCSKPARRFSLIS